jgi:hypothetical protein
MFLFGLRWPRQAIEYPFAPEDVTADLAELLPPILSKNNNL